MSLLIQDRRVKRATEVTFSLYGRNCRIHSASIITTNFDWTVRFCLSLENPLKTKTKLSSDSLNVQNLKAEFDSVSACWKLTSKSKESLTRVFKANHFVNIDEALVLIEAKLREIQVIKNG